MIYLVKSGEYVKIGYTQSPRNRIADIAVSAPCELEVLLIIDGDRKDERILHYYFRDIHHHREWYKFTADIIKFVRSKIKHDRRYEFGFDDGFDLNPGEQVKRLRKQHNLTLAKLGKKLNITAQSVKETEQRENIGSVSINVLKRVANALGYKFEYRFYPLKEIQERAKATMALK